MSPDIDLVYCAKVLGTTDFKIIHGDTGIIMMDTNRQFSRRLKRDIRNPKTKPQHKERIRLIKDFNLKNYRASMDALSKKEQSDMVRKKGARILRKSLKP